MLAKPHTRVRPHSRGDSARKMVITAGIFDGLLGGGKGAAKVHHPRPAFKDKVTHPRLASQNAVPCRHAGNARTKAPYHALGARYYNE